MERQALPPTPPATQTQPSPAAAPTIQDTDVEITTENRAPVIHPSAPTPVASSEEPVPDIRLEERQASSHTITAANTRESPPPQAIVIGTSAANSIQPFITPSSPKQTPPVITSPENDQSNVNEEVRQLTNQTSISQKTGPAGRKRVTVEIDRPSKRQRVSQSTDAGPRNKTKPPSKKTQTSNTISSLDVSTEQPTAATSEGEQAPSSSATTKRKSRQKRANTGVKTKSAKKPTDQAADQTTNQLPKKRGRPRKRKSREPTPEDAEDAVIAPSQVKMADLCKDTRKGKKSNRERELAKLEKANAARRKSARQAEQAEAEQDPQREGEEASTSIEIAATTAETPTAPKGRARPRARAVPTLRMVNGRMVVDEQSLQIDRHANAAEEEDVVEEVEENDLTRKVTSATWMKRERKEAWSEELTDRFYHGLSMFGTDFMIISKLFPGRSRRQIKLKFTKEERLDPQRIKDALVGPKEPMDLALLMSHTNVEYEDPAEFHKELEREAQEHADEQKRQEEQAQETLREKRAKNAAAIAANDSDAEGEASGAAAVEEGQEETAAGRRATRGKKATAASSKSTKATNRKKKPGYHGGGEEDEILGTIG